MLRTQSRRFGHAIILFMVLTLLLSILLPYGQVVGATNAGDGSALEIPDDPTVREILDGDERITYLGTPVTSQIVGLPNVGMEEGRAVGYQTFKGIGDTDQPGAFVVFDLETGEMLRSFMLDGADNNHGMAVAADGRVYLGTYHDYALHRYDPVTKTMENLGQINPGSPRDAYPYKMSRGPGNSVFIGTYPRGDVWQFDPETGAFENWGHEAWGPQDPTQAQYIQEIVYNAARNELFLSTGADDPAIWRVDVSTREALRLTNDTKQPGLSGESFIRALTVIDDHVFARGYASKKLLVIDREGNTKFWGAAGGTKGNVQGHSFAVHPSDPDKVLFSNPNELWAYSLSQRSVTATGANIGSYLSAAMADPTNPRRLMGLSGRGTFVVDFDQPSDEPLIHAFSYYNPTVLETVLPGPNNTMWAAGYMAGLNQVDTRGNGELYPSSSGAGKQFESGIIRDGLMYLGAYSYSTFSVFDPSTPTVAPKELFRGDKQGFDRPITMTYDSKNDKAYMGSVPRYGLNQGGISVWDFKTSTVKHFTSEVVVDQGVSSAVFNPGDGMVYLGTNVDGGNGHPNSGQTEAYLITWDPETDTKVQEMIPVPGRRGITGLTIAPDGKIWGIAEEFLFVFDPDTQQVTNKVKILGSGYGTGNKWAFGYIAYSVKDGMMYASLGNRLVRINPETLKVTNVGSGRGARVHADGEGNLYFIAYYGSQHLFRYTPQSGPGDDGEEENTMIEFINPSFEERVEEGKIPGWNKSSSGKNIEFIVTDEMSFDGLKSLKIINKSSTQGALVETDPIFVAPGETYTVSVKIYVQEGLGQLYLRYFDKDGKRLVNNSVLGNSPKKWEEVSITHKAPENAAYATIVLYAPIAGMTTAYFDDVVLTKAGQWKEIIATVDPTEPSGKNGWYTSPVTLTLSPAPIAEYSLDGGNSWLAYGGPVALSEEGTHQLLYRSSVETRKVKAVEVKIDLTAPEVVITGEASYTIDQEVVISCTARDGVSGISGTPCDQPLLQSKAYTLQPGEHTVTVTAEDLAGHQTTVTHTFTVIFNTSALLELIDSAQTKHDSASEGTKKGEYPAGSKSLLQAAIIAAQTVADDESATLEQVEQAVTDLKSAIKNFEESVNTSNTVTMEELLEQLEAYIVSNDVRGPLVNQLSNSLRQAQHHYSAGRTAQASKHLEDFLKRMNNPPMERHIEADAKQTLEQIVHELLVQWDHEDTD